MVRQLSLLLLCAALTGCSTVEWVRTFESDSSEGWQRQGFPVWDRGIPAPFPWYTFKRDAIEIVVSPDPILQVPVSWGPPYLPIIPDPLLLLLPVLPHGASYWVCILVNADTAATSGDTATGMRWVIKPREAMFSVSGGACFAADSIILGKGDLWKSLTMQDARIILTPDSLSEAIRLTAARKGILFRLPIGANGVDSLYVEELGLYRYGMRFEIPPLKMRRSGKLVVHWNWFD